MPKKSILPQDKFEQLKLFDKKPVGKPKPYIESEWIGEYRRMRDRCIELSKKGRTNEEIKLILGL